MPETPSAELTHILESPRRLAVEQEKEEALQRQANGLISEVMGALEGAQAIELVHRVDQLHDSLGDCAGRMARAARASSARAELINIVADFIRSDLAGRPAVRVTSITGDTPEAA
jgi:hypothetical protein